jgi:hypothetical protein
MMNLVREISARQQIFESAKLIFYYAFIQVYDPVTFAVTSENQIRIGKPSAQPR